ncbi:hypothetical protein N9I68_00555 [Bacteroidia bacterium]|nr:hypothetical protein [Bacteroidia bacterium]MDB4107007.1 hypothetical protein [Bacteroidia bacterium]
MHFESFTDKNQAMRREKWFKTGVGRELKASIIEKFLMENP